MEPEGKGGRGGNVFICLGLIIVSFLWEHWLFLKKAVLQLYIYSYYVRVCDTYHSCSIRNFVLIIARKV
jgi:hypothetical protein